MYGLKPVPFEYTEKLEADPSTPFATLQSLRMTRKNIAGPSTPLLFAQGRSG